MPIRSEGRKATPRASSRPHVSDADISPVNDELEEGGEPTAPIPETVLADTIETVPTPKKRKSRAKPTLVEIPLPVPTGEGDELPFTDMPELSAPVVNDGGMVHVEKSFTKNLGDYNSAKVTVGLTMPVGATAADFERAKVTYVTTSNVVDEFLLEHEKHV